MKRRAIRWGVACGAILAFAGTSRAAEPQLGGAMKHIFITLYAPTKTLYHFVQDGADERVMLNDYGESYDGDASVLDGMHYSARFGWLADGAWSVPAGRNIFVRVESQTPGLQTHGQNDFAPIFGTAGSSDVWLWNTTMVHNWYSVDACGWYEATYTVYVGFPDGSEDVEYTSTSVTLKWQFAMNTSDVLGDQDGDGDADLRDFALLQTCFGSDATNAISVCGCFDADADEDVDASDYVSFASEMGN